MSNIWQSLAQWEKDRCVLIAAENYVSAEHIAPSFLDLCRATDISSTSVVSSSLRRLEAAGFVKLPHNRTRSLQLLRSSSFMVAPVFGRRRKAADLLATAYTIINDGVDDDDQVGAWVADYERWRRK